MKIKDIKEYGYYADKNDNKVIVEAFKDDDNGKEILSIMIWEWFKTSDGIKFYQTDMFALNPENDDFCDVEVIPLIQKFKVVDDNDPYYIAYGASSVMYEDKLSNSEKLDQIRELIKSYDEELKSSENYDDYSDGYDAAIIDYSRQLKEILND